MNCSLLELAGLKQVISEPIISESEDSQLRADWAARGFREPQKQALFDCCIVNAESSSLKNTPLQTTKERTKRSLPTRMLLQQEGCHLPHSLPLAMQYLTKMLIYT